MNGDQDAPEQLLRDGETRGLVPHGYLEDQGNVPRCELPVAILSTSHRRTFSGTHSRRPGLRLLRWMLIASCMCVQHAGNMSSALAGMPALLPTNWTAGSEKSSKLAVDSDASTAMRVQAISFFLVVFLSSAWILQRLWNVVAPTLFGFPRLDYRRALSLTTLWGLAMIVVLTMISGARELMTPGAWKKQGWTYSLNQTSGTANDDNAARTARREGLERLRTALWQYAAIHQGRLPNTDNAAIPEELWNVAGCTGLKFSAVRDRIAEEAGRLYVFEPDFTGDERLVLLTNGFIGTMNSSEIRAAVAATLTSSDSFEQQVPR